MTSAPVWSLKLKMPLVLVFWAGWTHIYVTFPGHKLPCPLGDSFVRYPRFLCVPVVFLLCSCCVPACPLRRFPGPPASLFAFVALWLCWGLLPRPVAARGCRAAALSSPLHHQFESILFIFSSPMRMAENRALRASIHASYINDSDPEGMKSQLCENGLS